MKIISKIIQKSSLNVTALIFLSSTLLIDPSLGANAHYSSNDKLAPAGKWSAILGLEKGDKGMIHIAFISALQALYQRDSGMFEDADRFKKTASKAGDTLFNLPTGMQFFLNEPIVVAPDSYAVKCRLTGALAGRDEQKTYYAVVEVPVERISQASQCPVTIYTEDEYAAWSEKIKSPQPEQGGNVDITKFENVKNMPQSVLHERLKEIRFKPIATETHSLVLSNESLDYVIKIQHATKDRNNSFNQYQSYSNLQSPDLPLAEYFVTGPVELSISDGPGINRPQSVIQEKVDIMATELSKLSDADVSRTRAILDGFKDVHLALSKYGLIDKLFTVAGLPESERRPRKYLTNIGFSHRTNRWVHIDCADLSDNKPDFSSSLIERSLFYVMAWFPFPELLRTKAYLVVNTLLHLRKLTGNMRAAENPRTDIKQAQRTAQESGKKIPTNAYQRYQFIVPFEFFGNDRREYNLHRDLYRDRFYLEYISDHDKERYIDKVIAKAASFKDKSIALVPHDTPREYLAKLNLAGIRFITVNIEELMYARVSEPGYRHIVDFQTNSYAIMMLARSVDGTDKTSQQYKTLRFYLRSHFTLQDVSADQYIEAIISGNVDVLVNGILSLKPAEPYRLPEYNTIAPLLTAA